MFKCPRVNTIERRARDNAQVRVCMSVIEGRRVAITVTHSRAEREKGRKKIGRKVKKQDFKMTSERARKRKRGETRGIREWKQVAVI